MDEHYNVVIIGGGIAGVTAAEAARNQSSEISICIVSQEAYLPYYRLRICEVIDNPSVKDSLLLHPEEWYQERNIHIYLNKTVFGVAPDNNEITLSDNSRVSYDSLIVASGSISFVPPIQGIGRPGVHTLWTMADALEVEAILRDKKKVVVIGGGLLGLEAGYHFSRMGIATTIVEKMPRLLSNQLDEAGSEIFMRRVRSCGVNVITSGDIVSIKGADESDDSPVTSVLLADGSALEADLVLVSIGVRANSELARLAGISVEKRIKTDNHMRTSIPNIFSAGDVAEPKNFWFGLWSVSRAQGRVAGINAAGGDEVFEFSTPPYVLNTMDTKVAVLGEQGMLSEPQYELDVLMDTNSGNYRKLVYREGVFRGFILVGDTHEFSKLQKEIKKT